MMRTVAQYDVDYIFKQMFSLKQPHELSKKEWGKLTKKMRLSSVVLTQEYFEQSAIRMGINYEDLFFRADPQFSHFSPIVFTDFYVQDGISGFMGEGFDSNCGDHIQELKEEMDKGDFNSVFRQIDERGRHLAYFKLFDRIPNDQKFDIFSFNLGSPGMKYFFTKEEVREIISFNQFSKRYKESMKLMGIEHGESQYYKVYQPDFGIYWPVCHDFLWKLRKEDAEEASHLMGMKGIIKERFVHIRDVLHYHNEDNSIEALPNHTRRNIS